MEQLQIKKEGEQQVSTLGLQFKQIKDIPVKQTRIVKLLYASCCGCGCHDVTLEREVDINSSYQDGDRAASVLKTDKIVK